MPAPVINETVVNKKKAQPSSYSLPKEEEVSVKTDSGIADDAKPKKSKSKKQKEKKAAAAAAAIVAAAIPTLQQTKSETSAKSINKELGINDKIVIDIVTKPKDKKKKSKKDSSVSTEQKPKDEKVKILERL